MTDGLGWVASGLVAGVAIGVGVAGIWLPTALAIPIGAFVGGVVGYAAGALIALR
jgi:hypothetical protein